MRVFQGVVRGPCGGIGGEGLQQFSRFSHDPLDVIFGQLDLHGVSRGGADPAEQILTKTEIRLSAVDHEARPVFSAVHRRDHRRPLGREAGSYLWRHESRVAAHAGRQHFCRERHDHTLVGGPVTAYR